MSELAFLTIAEASRLIGERKLSPVELTEAYLDRIAALDSQLDSFVTLTDLLTDADGRIPNLLSPFELEAATYQISWDAGSFYKPKGGEPAFVRIVSLAFQVTDTQRHYHVPLLMTRYACTTYRGS